MKLIRIISIFALTIAIYSSCHKDEELKPGEYYPQYAPYRIVIPEYMGNPDEYYGNYEHEKDGDKIVRDLRRYIGISDVLAQHIEQKIYYIYQFEEGIDTSYTYYDTILTEYKENVMFEDNLYNYYVSRSRIGAQGNEPNGIYLQHFYNLEPNEGIIIYHGIIQILDDYFYGDSSRLFKARLDYDHADSRDYDKVMEFSIENLSVSHELPMDKFKIFAGMKDHYLDLRGNFNLPNSEFITEDVGFSWSFVASGDMSERKGVFEIGLPPCSFNSTSRIEILEDHSAYKVLAEQLFQIHPNINNNYNAVLHYINHIVPPYFVDQDGFVNSDSLPNDTYITIKERLPALVPYNPSEIEALEVTFGE